MHLTLEVDESKGTVANKSDAVERALTVVRNRIDELGVSEPIVQKAGEDRILVELPGVDDPARARFHEERAPRGEPTSGYAPPRLAVPTLRVDTSDGYTPDLDTIVAFARALSHADGARSP